MRWRSAIQADSPPTIECGCLGRLQATLKRPSKILIRLCAKRLYQLSMRSIRRLQSSLIPLEMSGRGFLKQFKIDFPDESALIRFFEQRETPFFYWPCKYRHHIVRLIEEHYPVTVSTTIQEADTIGDHIFDLLGSGPINLGRAMDWHQDFKSGYRWPMRFYVNISQMPFVDHADVKIPRELSRCHHFVTLSKAYLHTHNEIYAREFISQFMDWIGKNPPRMTVNWCSSMDVAIRMVNWIWAYYFFTQSPHFDMNAKIAFLKSVHSHAQFIIENLEYYGEFSDNHYVSNIVGLLFAGILFPEFKRARRWRRLALNALFSEIHMQVHDDGVHFEGSIGYHRLVLEMFVAALILCKKNSIEIPRSIWHRLEKMFEFVLYYTKPDGLSPQIGDTDNGRLQILGQTTILDHRYLLAIGAVLFERGDFKKAAGAFHEDALWLLGPEGFDKFESIQAEESPVTSRSFDRGGFYFMRNQELYMAVHCAPNGRRGIGNHSHNDTLSFELFAYEKSFIVDPGTYVYTADPDWRNLFRSTAYHNTVMVDGAEINRIMPGKLFELTNDAIPKVNRWKTTGEFDVLDAEHDGYERLDEPVTHRRQFCFDKVGSYWIVSDLLTGQGKHRLDWFFHFGAGIDVCVTDQLAIETCCQEGANLLLQAISDSALHLTLEEGWISPSYGVKERGQVVRFSCYVELPMSVTFFLCPYRSDEEKAERTFRMTSQYSSDRSSEDRWGFVA